ncbi:ABC transporter substrate-binding protein [Sphingomonas sp. MMS12-HWE2-04]|uniref:ABC transporter substrate-binding protein n=1 Tax=Sphingomonas sp. MMS12-HWE2-04 TaxID=3234199 RepID=UPI00384C0010
MKPFLVTLPIAAALAAGGCGGGQGTRKDNVAVVVSAIGGGAKLADPSDGPLDAAERIVLGATAQGLVRFDAAGQVEPALAERWIVIDDGRSYIFRLREASWPDGQPVTASEVVRVLRRAAAPGSRNALAPFLAVIDEIVEMTPQVIEVRLKRPRPDLLKLFAQPELAVFRARTLDGSGPFRVREARDGWMFLTPGEDPLHPDDRDPARPEEQVQLRGERAGLAIARFRAARSDLVLGGSFDDWPILLQAGIAQPNIQVEQPLGLFGLVVTAREGFLADAQNRAALSMAIDRAAVTAILPDWAPVETLLPNQLDSAAPPARPDWATLAPDARRALARNRVAVWTRTQGEPLVVRIALPNGPGGRLAFAHIAASLIAIGIEPQRVGPRDRAELRLIDATAPYDSGRWFVQTACVACSDEAAALIAAGREAPDLAARAQRIAEADAALTADAAYIPIAQPLRWSVAALRLGAWQRNTRGWHPLNHLRNETE